MRKEHIIGMSELEKDISSLGNKMKNLLNLNKIGVRIPRGIGLTYDVYTNHISHLMPELLRAREQAINYIDMEKRLQAVVTSVPLIGTDEILEALERDMPNVSYFAVRSSGAPIINNHEIIEDSAGISLAGQYESFLLVPKENVPQAILLCYASLFNERCLRQFNVMENINYLNSRMSVLIQEMCQADLSAVVMTRDPVEGGDNFGIEITYGACESLVSGIVQGDLYLLSRTTGTILDTQLGTKKVCTKYIPFCTHMIDNKVTYITSEEQRIQYAASTELVKEIYNLSMEVEKCFNVPQDIELVVSGNEITIVQTRPITTCI